MSQIASFVAFVIVALIVTVFAAMILAGLFMMLLVPATLFMAALAGITKNPQKSS